MSEDLQCVCKGNWRLILSEVEHLIDRDYTDFSGRVFTFFGLVHGGDDYYYGMYAADNKPHNCKLLSCVGSIEGHGYSIIEEVWEEETEHGDDVSPKHTIDVEQELMNILQEEIEKEFEKQTGMTKAQRDQKIIDDICKTAKEGNYHE